MTVNAIIKNSPYQTEIRAGNNVVISDEKVEHGGQDTGMTPHELLASSLASCTAITLRMYADRKLMPVTEIKVSVDISENASAPGTMINLVIELIGNLSDDQKKRLLDISNKCPIHKLLTNSVLINSTLL